MILIIVILLTSFIIEPLIDLSVNERFRPTAKIIFYVLCLIFVVYYLIIGRVV